MLALEDLAGKTEQEVKDHIASEYNPKEGGYPYETETAKLRAELDQYEILLAYESVGSWGCDSSSFFLLRKDGKLYQNHGSHCSCYGFEGQWEPEETEVDALKRQEYWSLGGYDNSPEENRAAIKNFIGAL